MGSTPKKLRQAVIVVHGMGEQVPMQTVRNFVDTVWVKDSSLINSDRPVRGSDQTKRLSNMIWNRLDGRTGLFETGRITTETADNRARTDFFEFYWAHLVHGTTWDQVRAWIGGLLWRNPLTRVPKDVRLAWGTLWIITIAIIMVALFSILPKSESATLPTWFNGLGISGKALTSIFSAIVSALSAAFIANVMIKRFGDVVRYTQAEPLNIARREEIRKEGVKLFSHLINQRDEEYPEQPHYDRIIVVAHSLGSIVAYDILSECFARNCQVMNDDLGDDARQPARARLEEFVRKAVGQQTAENFECPVSLDTYQALQDDARVELNEMGANWQVSDFVTLGSPLTHAEFLMTESVEDLKLRQAQRILATCPPTQEYDGATKLWHFTFRAGKVSQIGKLEQEEKRDIVANCSLPRMPHHAAIFGYTKWTNIYSPHKLVFFGDVISGPLKEQFQIENGKQSFCGIKDIAVLPKMNGTKKDKNHKHRFFSHNAYWSMSGGTEQDKNKQSDKTPPIPHHIEELRKALNLGQSFE